MAFAQRVRRFTANRPRLLGSLLGAVVVYLLLSGRIAAATRLVLAWDAGVVAFLLLTTSMFLRSTPQRLRLRAQREDPAGWVILALMTAAALASLLSIGFVLHDAKQQSGWLAVEHVGLAGLTILLSWAFAHTMFAIHYAHVFYGDSRRGVSPANLAAVAGGLAFPTEDNPDYWDFLYFSFVVGMTCQVSDVQVTGRVMRRLTLGHGIIAFLFNTVILALTINLLAGLL